MTRLFCTCGVFSIDSFFFFFNDTATTEIYTLSLHDALPISHIAGHAQQHAEQEVAGQGAIVLVKVVGQPLPPLPRYPRSEEHTSELQSRPHLVCRLLLEKKKKLLYHSTQTPI